MIETQFLNDPNTSVVTLLAIIVTKYGTEALNWDPVTLRQQIEKDYGIPSLHKLVDGKIQAGTVVLTTNAFHTSLETFSNVCSAFSSNYLTSDTYFNPADLTDVLIGTLDVKLLEGDDFVSFSDNIKRFVGMLLDKAGMYKVPDILSWAYLPNVPKEKDFVDNISQDSIGFKAFWEMQQETKDDIEKNLKEHIKKVFQEVNQLPDNYIDKTFVNKMLTTLS